MGYGADTTTDEVLEGVDLTGKTAVITGASGGLGQETARALASKGARVVLAARDRDKTAAAVAAIEADVPGAEVETVTLDLASLDSVQAAAADILERFPVVDMLIDNAGVMACPFGRTADGFEMQFGTNHLGHFLFTTLLVPALLASGAARVAVVSSGAHLMGPVDLDDPNFESAEYNNWLAYAQSKSANALFALELDRRLADRGVRAFSLHPGVIMTDLSRHLTPEDLTAMAEMRPGGGEFVFKEIPAGAATSVWAATAPELDAHGGAYLADCQVAPPTTEGQSMGYAEWAVDTDAAGRLWTLSEELVGHTTDF